MSWVWKLVLSIYNLALVALGTVMISMAAGNAELLNTINNCFASPWQRVWTGAVGGLLFVLGIMLLLVSLRRENPEAVLIRDAAGGQIFITIPAVEQVILKSARSLAGVREARPVIKSLRTGIKVYLHLLVAPDTVIPELTAELQQVVKAEVEHMVGIPVLEIKVLVDDTEDRRERKQGGRL